MMPALLAFAVVAATAPVVEATEGSARSPLQLRPKAALTAAAAPTHTSAPFVAPLIPEPDLDLLPPRDARLEASRSSCSGRNSLCYDPHSGRIVYKPARALMPQIPGLQRENISVKRDRVTFKYSF